MLVFHWQPRFQSKWPLVYFFGRYLVIKIALRI
jgi:hypothetical protein